MILYDLSDVLDCGRTRLLDILSTDWEYMNILPDVYAVRLIQEHFVRYSPLANNRVFEGYFKRTL